MITLHTNNKQYNVLEELDNLKQVTYNELVDLRNTSKLIPGCWYRITDYQCTTTQENTMSANHQFDIVVLALSENVLSEEARAIMHDNIYDVVLDDGTYRCYYNANLLLFIKVDDTQYAITEAAPDEFTVDEATKTITFDNGWSEEDFIYQEHGYICNYFQNSNLSAWKVWYCLDNDKTRFAWADDSVNGGTPANITFEFNELEFTASRDKSYDEVSDNINYYGWSFGKDVLWTISETPEVGDNCYSSFREDSIFAQVTSYTPGIAGLPNGYGVIYRLIDEFNNDIKYDFKNIQFKRKLTDGRYDANGTDTWCYTLNLWHNNVCHDASIIGNTIPDNKGFVKGVYDNKFGYVTANDRGIYGVSTFAFVLGDNVILSFEDFGYTGIYSNIIGNASYDNTIGNSFQNNVIGNRFSNNIIGNDFSGNIIGNYFNGRTIGNDINYKNYGNNGFELATKDDINVVTS